MSSPAPQFESINSLSLSLLYGPTLTFIHDYWKIHSFDYMDLCGQSDAGRDWGQEEKGMTEDEMAGWHHRLDGCESE